MSIQGPPDFNPEQAKLLLIQMIEDLFGSGAPSQEIASLAERLFVPKQSNQGPFAHTAKLLAALSTDETAKPPLRTTSIAKEPPPAKQTEPRSETPRPFLSPQQVRLAMEALATLVPREGAKEKPIPEKLKALVQELIQAVGRKETDSSDGKRRLPVFHTDLPKEKTNVKKSIPLPFGQEKKVLPEKMGEKHSVVAKEETSLAPKATEESAPLLQQELRMELPRDIPQRSKDPAQTEKGDTRRDPTPFAPNPAAQKGERGRVPEAILHKENFQVPQKENPKSTEPPSLKSNKTTQFASSEVKRSFLPQTEKVAPMAPLPTKTSFSSRIDPIQEPQTERKRNEPLYPLGNEVKTATREPTTPRESAPPQNPTPDSVFAKPLPNQVPRERPHLKEAVNPNPVIAAGPFVIAPLSPLKSSKKRKRNEPEDESDPDEQEKSD